MSHARKKLTVLSLLVVGACVAATAEVSPAADAFVYRNGNFNRADVDMISCPADVLSLRHSDLHVAVGISGRRLSLSGARPTDGGALIWQIVARSTGSNSSHVELRDIRAASDKLEEVWQVIQACEKQR